LSLIAIINHLKIEKNMSNAKEILLTGDSAGGIGTFNNANWLQSQFPKVTGIDLIY
jgi:hypothetical protein